MTELMSASMARRRFSLFLMSDPLTFTIVPALLGIVALVACFVPARRATRVSAVQALRG